MNCSRDDVVLLPIPFTDLNSSKVRPAIVIGHGSFPGDLFVIPITSQTADWDLPLSDWQASGLNVPSGVKAQLATIDDRLVRQRLGKLTARDRAVVDQQLRNWLSL